VARDGRRDLDADAARAALEQPVPAERPPLYGDGRAGERVVDALVRMAG
jgi:UDP-GlcNAc3NAcA epimerase